MNYSKVQPMGRAGILEVDDGQATEAGDVTVIADRLLEIVPRLMRRIRAEMRTESHELTVVQLRVLLWVRRHPGGGLSPVAEHVGLSLPAASALVDRLVRAGLMDRAHDPTERRRLQLRLTPSGAERVALGQLAVRSWLAAELTAVDRDRLDGLAGAIDILEQLGRSGEPSR